MEIVTLSSADDIALSKGAADKLVILRASDFPQDAPTGSGLIAYAGDAASANARLDAGLLAARAAGDFPGEMFYFSQY
jgi:hypothetical protein